MSAIVAHYGTIGETADAIGRLRAAGHDDLEVFSPIPSPELEEALDIWHSPVRRWALIGGISGFLTACALTIWTSVAYPLVTQGKPIASIPPFVVIMFELTILFTGLFGLTGLLVLTRKPTLRLSPHYRAAFGVDRFGIVVAADEAARSEIESLLRETGAVEVEVSA